MKFTGERYIPTEMGKIRVEHYHRYAVAMSITAQKDVLDIACGEGYGANLLAETAKSVRGVDISNEAIAHAQANYQRSNLRFQIGAATNLNIADNSFDIVVSFETIEHLEAQAEMLSELKRVLRPGGVLIISSPNRPVYSQDGEQENHFHVKELDFVEFDDLLKQQFPFVKHFGQRMLMGSVIQPMDYVERAAKIFNDDGSEISEGLPRTQLPTYFVSVCTDEVSNLPDLEQSLLYPEKLDLVKEYMGFARWAEDLNDLLSERTKHLKIVQDELKERESQVLHFKKDAEDQRQIVNRLEKKRQAAEDSLSQIDELRSKFQAKSDSLQSELAEKSKRLSFVKNELAEAINSTQKMQSQHEASLLELERMSNAKNQQLQAKVSETQSILLNQKQQVLLLGSQKSTLEYEVETAKAVVAERDRHIAHLTDELSTRTEQVIHFKSECESLLARLDVQSNELANLEAANKDLFVFEEKYRAVSARLKNDTITFQSMIRTLRSARDAVVMRSSILEEAISEKNEELKNEQGRLTNILSEKTNEVESLTNEQRRLTSILSGKTNEVESLKIEQGRLTNILSEKTNEVESLTNEQRRLTSILSGKTNEVESLKIEQGRLTEIVSSITARNKSIKKKLKRSRKLNRALENKQHNIDDLIDILEAGSQTWQKSIRKHKKSILDLENEKIEFASNAAALKAELEHVCGNFAVMRDEFSDTRDQLIDLQRQLHASHSYVGALLSSSSWRYTRAFREAARWVRSPNQQLKRYRQFATQQFKSIYWALPIAHETNVRHRNWLKRNFPSLVDQQAELSQQINALPKIEKSDDNSKSQEKVILASDLIPSGTLSFPHSEDPKVSVIIPIYGKIDYTIRCLKSILDNFPSTPCEIIVVDDCSPDNSFEVLSEISGINLVKNKQNLGFIKTCNHGARVARGEYLYFLNNDTEVLAGWLDELHQTFDLFPGTGFAGSMLLYPDGRLQEAGGIIWQDGSAWNFGRLQDPNDPTFSYAREVDYVSGASIMVPSGLFEEVGGFDEHYSPAYCEDSDLALKVRSRGLRVIYQPLSKVIHHEGVTSGTDETQGVKSFQVENSRKLFDRWQEQLKSHRPNGVDPNNEKDRMAKQRVLVLDHCTPTPDADAGSITVFNLLMLLREMGFQVTFIAEDNFLYMPKETAALQKRGIEVLYAPFNLSVKDHLSQFDKKYDLAFLFRPTVIEKHFADIKRISPQTKVLYHTVDLHFLRMLREAELSGDESILESARKMKSRELKAIKLADGSIVHSAKELDIVTELVPGANLHVFPLIMDPDEGDIPFSDRHGVMFIGGYQHTPNVDAVVYFANEVMPILRNLVPGIKFYIIGSNAPDSVSCLAGDDIIVSGFIEKLSPFINTMRLSVAPLRYGAGIKGKIGTAMVAGLPVIGTNIAVEGMYLTDGENVVVANTPIEFAKAVAELYDNKEKWTKIRNNGLKFAKENWSAEASLARLAGVVQSLGIETTSPKVPPLLYDENRY